MQLDTFWARRLNGTVKFQPLEQVRNEPRKFIAEVASRHRLLWEPPYQISRLPSWFTLSLDCYAQADGTRRFSLVELPECDRTTAPPGLPEIATARGLSLVASLGGDALMLDRGEVKQGLLFTHDEARLFVQYIEHRQEYLGRRKWLDKVIRSPDERNKQRCGKLKSALPDDLGIDSCGRGQPWSISRFNDEAQSSAQNAGLESPTRQQLLSHGLFAAAKRNPLYIDSFDQAAAIVRLALFALPKSSDTVTDEQLQYVAVRVRESLRDHMEDTDEEFQRWIVDPKSDLLGRIAKPRSCPMNRNQVKRVLLELGWYALEMLGQCVDVQMRTFRDALPEPLTEKENFYFGQAFLANPALGGLPLLLLQDRYDDLGAAIVNVWNNFGSPESIAVLHRAMVYYAEFLGNRREADKIYKQRALAKNARDYTAIEQALDEAAVQPSPRRECMQFTKVAKAVAMRHGINCEFGEWEAELVSEDATVIRFKLRRAELKRAKVLTVPRSEFEAMARELRNLD